MNTSTLIIEATHLGLRDLSAWLSEFLAAQPDPAAEGTVASIELAIHELANNSVDHAEPADGIVTIDGSVIGPELTVRISDTGRAFDETPRSAPTEPQVRGYGLMIIEQIASSVDYERVDDRNIWTLRFELRSDEQLKTTSREVEQQA